MTHAALSARMDGLRSSAIRDLLTLTARPDVISLAGGLPDPDFIPRERISKAAHDALGDPSSVQYGETSGLRRLREVIAERESSKIGRTLDVSEVVITHGSQQGLSLLAQVLLDAGDVVVVEEPAYTGALQVFRTAQARLVPVQLDEDGMDTDALETKLAAGLRPKVVHTVSNFHNPRGAVLSAQRRAHLAALADRYGFWVLEDDPYGELYFGEKPPAPLAALSDRVIRLSSASKVLAPALRVGWLHGDRKVCEAVELIKQGADLCGSSLTQQIAADLFSDVEWFETHLDKLRGGLRRQSEGVGHGRRDGIEWACTLFRGPRRDVLLDGFRRRRRHHRTPGCRARARRGICPRFGLRGRSGPWSKRSTVFRDVSRSRAGRRRRQVPGQCHRRYSLTLSIVLRSRSISVPDGGVVTVTWSATARSHPVASRT